MTSPDRRRRVHNSPHQWSTMRRLLMIEEAGDGCRAQKASQHQFAKQKLNIPKLSVWESKTTQKYLFWWRFILAKNVKHFHASLSYLMSFAQRALSWQESHMCHMSSGKERHKHTATVILFLTIFKPWLTHSNAICTNLVAWCNGAYGTVSCSAIRWHIALLV